MERSRADPCRSSGEPGAARAAASGRRRRSGCGARARRRICGRSPRCTASAARSSAPSIWCAASACCSAGSASTCRARPAISTPTTPPRAAPPSPPCRITIWSASTSRRRTRRRTKGKADEKVKALEADRRAHRRPAAGGAAEARRLAHPGLAGPPHAAADARPRLRHGAVRHRRHGIASKGQASYDEVVAEKSDLVFEKGHDLMRRFLG